MVDDRPVSQPPPSLDLSFFGPWHNVRPLGAALKCQPLMDNEANTVRLLAGEGKEGMKRWEVAGPFSARTQLPGLRL